MNINILRSVNKKYPIVEISTSTTKILLDGGINLEENEVLLLADLQAEYDFTGVNAAFISHYNTDHVTMARGLLVDVPVYIGLLASQMATAAEGYKSKKPFGFAGFYQNGKAITVGDITVTPFLVDNPTYEGYMLLIEAEGKRVLYTGDYRANGRKSFEEMLAVLPTSVDLLICENGVISKEDINHVTERNLEEQVSELIASKNGPVFVLQSITDFDRTATMFYAAKSSKRVFLEDLYMAAISGAAGDAMPNPVDWVGTRAYLTTGYKEEHFRYKMFAQLPRSSKTDIASQKFVMCIRTSMKKYLKTLSQCMRFKDGIIINSLPAESWNSATTMEFLAFAVSKGLEVITLRTSGHADAMALKALIEAVNPPKLLPLDVQNAYWLKTQYPNLEVVSDNSVKL